MPTFREVNTGQSVTVDSDPRLSRFRRLARWKEQEGGKSKEKEVEKPVAEPQTSEDKAEEAPAVDATPAKPGDDADRDEWVAYALANGKTDADVKGTRVSTIRSWFDDK